jgi:propanol-preferring alcohol dehydrogenase
MYGGLRRAQLRRGDFIVIPGAGGGLGHLGVQLAALQGLRVIAVDTGSEKKVLCESLGAERFIDFMTTACIADEVRAITDGGGAHAVLCASGSSKAYDEALAMLRPCGKLICIGIPADPSYRIPVNPFEMVVKGIKIIGSSVGNKQDMSELMQLAAGAKIKAMVDGVYSLSDLEEILHMLRRGEVAGRVLVSLSD